MIAMKELLLKRPTVRVDEENFGASPPARLSALARAIRLRRERDRRELSASVLLPPAAFLCFLSSRRGVTPLSNGRGLAYRWNTLSRHFRVSSIRGEVAAGEARLSSIRRDSQRRRERARENWSRRNAGLLNSRSARITLIGCGSRIRLIRDAAAFRAIDSISG